MSSTLRCHEHPGGPRAWHFLDARGRVRTQMMLESVRLTAVDALQDQSVLHGQVSA